MSLSLSSTTKRLTRRLPARARSHFATSLCVAGSGAIAVAITYAANSTWGLDVLFKTLLVSGLGYAAFHAGKCAAAEATT